MNQAGRLMAHAGMYLPSNFLAFGKEKLSDGMVTRCSIFPANWELRRCQIPAAVNTREVPPLASVEAENLVSTTRSPGNSESTVAAEMSIEQLQFQHNHSSGGLAAINYAVVFSIPESGSRVESRTYTCRLRHPTDGVACISESTCPASYAANALYGGDLSTHDSDAASALVCERLYCPATAVSTLLARRCHDCDTKDAILYFPPTEIGSTRAVPCPVDGAFMVSQ